MPNNIGRILIIDDDEDVLYSARLLLKQHYSTVRTEKIRTAFRQYLRRNITM